MTDDLQQQQQQPFSIPHHHQQQQQQRRRLQRSRPFFHRNAKKQQQQQQQLSGLVRPLEEEEEEEDEQQHSTERQQLQRQNNFKRQKSTHHGVTTGSSQHQQQTQQQPQHKNYRQLLEHSPWGQYKFHGTGNPLALRSPRTPKTMAIDNMANIIQSGHLGFFHKDSNTGSNKKTMSLKTEQGTAGSSFWTDRLQWAGQYGWTGLILPPNADTTQPFSIANVVWFLVEESPRQLQETLLLKTTTSSSSNNNNNDNNNSELWDYIKDRVITVDDFFQKIVLPSTTKK